MDPELNFIQSATTNGSSITGSAQGLSKAATGNVGSTGVGGASLTAPVVDAPTAVAGAGGAAGAQQGTGWFGEHGKANTIIGGVQVLGSLWNSFQQHKMAKEQMKFAREQWDTNLENQTQTYNTSLEDRIRSRHFSEGKDAQQTDAYLNEHSL